MRIHEESLERIDNNQWNVHSAYSESDALELLDRHDYKVGLAHIDFTNPKQVQQTENIIISSHAEWVALLGQQDQLKQEQCKKAILNGFYDYHTLPTQLGILLNTLGHAYGMSTLKKNFADENLCLLNEDEMVGTSPAMRSLFSNIRKLARVDAPVLINGESGTGKELSALAIHERSGRRNAPFVAVNCGALPDKLIQTELFGHEKGAFTGAYQRKIGKIEAASGGTLFLDEIGDLPLEQQTSLLRFLQEKTIERVGSSSSLHVDVRVIAATHVNLEQAIQEGRFREDLYYRLNVVNLVVPPLRERVEDIEVLAKYFFNKFYSEAGNGVIGFSQQALRAMNDYTWPGNVREMINKVRRAMLMCESRLISATDLGLERRSTGKRRILTIDAARSNAEVEAIINSLRQSRNNISQAARTLDVSRVTLYRLMEKHSISI
ncbi:sigma-54 dependent transcriptional regulator [Sulfuriflexus sp.]|uniref:sigma-54 dependent transcriptional regulator n=1 Tax=Sulfuriflexus sp. TaxID=2015443 RepID=UPI0028CE6A75|nr:sigma-54 dependent transcriptional regulator [Sulfuriflexus sp.]MDT8405536.1 sigma-54 dependent transcriptional regulator [Sulfuriflexus sp.]